MKAYYEEEVIRLSERLTDLIIYFNPLKKKKDLINLLDRLNHLIGSLRQEYDEFSKEVEGKKSIWSGIYNVAQETSNYTYLFGKISISKSIMTSLLEKIADLEKEIPLTEEEKKVIEEAKKDEDLNYLG